MKKTYLAWIFCGTDYYQSIIPSFFLLKKLSENFDKVYLINLEKLKLFKDFHSYTNKLEISELDKKKFTFQDNVEIFNPQNKSEFKNFMMDKNIVAINNLGRYFADIPLHFLLSKYKIKQIQVSFVGNIQHNQFRYKKIFKSIIYLLNRNLSYKIITILSNLGLAPKIDIRFTSLKFHFNKKTLLKKILEYINFPYIKKYILVNSRSYDLAINEKDNLSEDKIIFLDFMVNNVENKALRGELSSKNYNEHYKNLVSFLSKFQVLFNKKITICIHPRDNFSEKEKIFQNFEVVQFKTRENILKSSIVLFFESSAIIDAIILKKKIITLHSDYLDKPIKEGSDRYKNQVGVLQLNINETDKLVNKEKLLKILENNISNYDNYIRKNIKSDTDEMGSSKIIRIIKENYFTS